MDTTFSIADYLKYVEEIEIPRTIPMFDDDDDDDWDDDDDDD